MLFQRRSKNVYTQGQILIFQITYVYQLFIYLIGGLLGPKFKISTYIYIYIYTGLFFFFFFFLGVGGIAPTCKAIVT